MKKNVLALSITAALVVLTGGAHAMSGALGGADATVQEFNGGGTGHSLIVPYFSTQGGNKTLINIVNTDLYNGKAVKVRFRGAANSDDIFDFQVFMSPGDVYAVEINQGADGKSRLVTNDVSCTKPLRSVLNGASFLTARLDSTTMTAAQQNNGTREGYVEIFNMADIPKDVRGTIAAGPYADAKTDITAGMSATSTVNPLYTAIKHVNKVAPCESAVAPGTAESAAAWTFLDNNNLTYGAAAKTTPSSAGMLAPTTGLMANWTIINVAGAAAWSGEATAVEARVAAGTMATAPTTGVLADRANMGNVVYWPQTDALVDPASPSTTTAIVEAYSADPIFRTANVYTAGTTATATAATAGAIRASFYDLPDMSTPYVTLAATPLVQAKTLTNSLATKSIRNEFLTDATIAASTDWLFSLPTRRYSVAFDYNFTAVAATNDGRRFTDINGDPTLLVTAFFNQSSTFVASNVDTFTNGRQICAKLGLGVIVPRDREESKNDTPGAGVVISPSPIAVPTQFNICGEAAVLSVNNGAPVVGSTTGALKANVAIRDADLTYRDGWATLSTPAAAGALIGLPVLGSAFSRAVGPTNGQTFGVSSNHRFQR